MEKIPSFTINHLILQPGVYLSRTDQVGETEVLTYDLRMTAPNIEPVMNTAEIHTIEHIVATFLRNHPKYKQDVIYFGPMGCRTGFYLILTDRIKGQALLDFIREAFQFTADFEGDIPGATARDCGNYLDQNLPMAKYQAKKYIQVLDQWTDLTFTYPE